VKTNFIKKIYPKDTLQLLSVSKNVWTNGWLAETS